MSIELLDLTENKVVSIVAEKLKNLNFNVLSTCSTKEHGIDIVSEKNGYTLLIEAKGATSSDKNSKRSGKPFDRNQARTHISVAIFTAMQLFTKNKDNDGYIVGIALPYEKNHLEFIKRVRYALESIGVILFWVKGEEVIIESSNITVGNLFKK